MSTLENKLFIAPKWFSLSEFLLCSLSLFIQFCNSSHVMIFWFNFLIYQSNESRTVINNLWCSINVIQNEKKCTNYYYFNHLIYFLQEATKNPNEKDENRNKYQENVLFNAQYRELIALINYQREKLSSQQADLTKVKQWNYTSRLHNCNYPLYFFIGNFLNIIFLTALVMTIFFELSFYYFHRHNIKMYSNIISNILY